MSRLQQLRQVESWIRLQPGAIFTKRCEERIRACVSILQERSGGQVANRLSSYVQKCLPPTTCSEMLNGAMGAWKVFRVLLCQKQDVIIPLPTPSVMAFIPVNLVPSFCQMITPPSFKKKGEKSREDLAVMQYLRNHIKVLA